MNCGLFRRHLDAYVDAEVDPNTQIEFERHASMCASCQEALVIARAMKARVHESLSGVRAPEALRAKIMESLENAPAPIRAAKPARGFSQNALKARYSVPLGLAAAAAILFAMFTQGGNVGGGAVEASSIPMFEDVVRLHSSELPVDVSHQEQVPGYFRGKVDFPVMPSNFRGMTAQLVGARLSNVRDHRAAALYYNVHGSRVTVVLFSAPRQVYEEAIPVQRSGREVRYRQVGGYVVPVGYHNGVAYALTGDVGREELFKLASMVNSAQ